MGIQDVEDFIKIRGKKINKTEIEKFEEWCGYKLPKDFVEFTLKYPFAHMSAEFDADGRPVSMISDFLRFSKKGYSSIYVDEAYDITDFGPYVLFGEDPGGNYIAFDYSKDELNPSVVFIDHEELGIIELPEGTSENDFKEEELDKMMSSEKLEDFPWAIHFVADSFNAFINNLTISVSSDKIKKTFMNLM
ncbi:SMI1/KNR4 family protein [Macrococcus capreoli]|uniref:SMI1/KNR4 family protein n=1 Tax=Macrococcus capreoli TaxID=2982690 RepID=UPI0021D587F5|nr:SMI1/KNR4 family protein [Macrococcus sp. TMW 2.2395]MCU7557217.1 SMI1/KNR4 family protein [Macrococcus sp. TMW 2.2395]